eukprot:10263343-Karenia_brevis.AAC.1
MKDFNSKDLANECDSSVSHVSTVSLDEDACVKDLYSQDIAHSCLEMAKPSSMKDFISQELASTSIQ